MRTPTKGIDYTSRDYEAFRALLLEKIREKMPEYTDMSESDAGVVIVEALANGLDILSLYADIVANDVILPTTQSRGMAVLIAQTLGYTPFNQTASEYEQVFVLGSARTSDTVIPKGTVVKTSADNSLETIYFETQDDLVIPAGALGNEKNADDEYIYHVTVKSGQSISQDIIGSSNGSPLQSFELSYPRVLIDSLSVYVNEGGGSVLWTRVDSFVGTTGDSKVYTVSVDDFDTCIIQFGNGINGKIPLAFTNGISAFYRIGGGEESNVSAGAINTLDTPIAYVESTFNLSASVLAHDKEELESIKINAPASFRSRERLVTLQDYADLLLKNFYPFFDIKALRDTNDKKKALIYYKMKDGYTMDADLTSAVESYIESREMIGTTYALSAYTPDTVDITANLIVGSDYDAVELESQVTSYLQTVSFADLHFGESIIKSDVENAIKETFEGVYSFRIVTPNTDIISPATDNSIIELGTVSITTTSI